jgi:hypothetical protein
MLKTPSVKHSSMNYNYIPTAIFCGLLNTSHEKCFRLLQHDIASLWKYTYHIEIMKTYFKKELDYDSKTTI